MQVLGLNGQSPTASACADAKAYKAFVLMTWQRHTTGANSGTDCTRGALAKGHGQCHYDFGLFQVYLLILIVILE